MNEPNDFSASTIIKKIRSKELRAEEVSKIYLDRIQQINPYINAVHQINPEKVLLNAKQADLAIHSGKKLGKLHGLPLTIKDTCHVKDFICSKGCPGLFKTPSTYDSTVVSRLKAEGAIILGITNTSELLLAYESDNLIYGRTNNPYNLERTPGGSSGGEAAIIAACGSPAGIGSDAGGSIRQPAHYCGICGHKPTKGLVPLTGAVPTDGGGIAIQLLAMGPMARYVEDLILLMEVISGQDQIDPHVSSHKFVYSKDINLKSLRVAYFYDNPTGTIPDNDTITAVENVIKLLQSEVHSLREDFPKALKNTFRLHLETFMFGGDGGEFLQNFLNSIGQQTISKLTHEFLSISANYKFSVTELRQRFLEVERFRYDMMRFMLNYDVIITPVTATPARLHGETFKFIHDVGYVIAHNLTGWPATVVPCGFSKDGLPIGVQIAAKPWCDSVSLAVAMKLQQILGVFPSPQII